MTRFALLKGLCEMIWGLAAVGLVLLVLPSTPRVRFTVVAAVALLALAVFQTAGGRERFELSFTTVVVLAIGAIALLQLRRQVLLLAFLPLLAYLAFGYLLLWPGSAGLVGNGVNLLVAVAAWAGGLWLAVLHRGVTDGLGLLTRLVVLILVFEAVISLLQLAGVPVFPLDGRTLDLEGGRVNATFAHPATAGKVVTLLLVLLLPATRAPEASTRRLAYVGIAVATIPVFASLSRANIIALLAMVLVWSLIQPRTKFFGARFVLPAVVGIAVLFVLDALLARFAADPEGGERGHLLSVALTQLQQTPVFGVGPGQYLQVVGSFDQLTSEGWPVHNIFVLEAVELGIVGAILLFGPLVVALFAALRAWRKRGATGNYARAMIAYVPAIAVIGTTGWGLIDVTMSSLLMFVFGFTYLRMRDERSDQQSVPMETRAKAFRGH